MCLPLYASRVTGSSYVWKPGFSRFTVRGDPTILDELFECISQEERLVYKC